MERTSQRRQVGHPESSQGKRAMTFQDLMAMKRVSDPQISPSGKWVLFSVTDVSLEKNTKVNHLWVVPLQPTSQTRDVENRDSNSLERQVTFGDGEENGRFSPDGRFVSISMKGQIYLAPWDEAKGMVGEARALTSVSTGADGGVWSPDSKRVLFVSSVYPECAVVDGVDEAAAGPTHRDGAAMNGARTLLKARSFVEEDGCDEMLYFPDEGHWVTKPQNAELWNKTVSDWCDWWTHTNTYAGTK